MSQHVFDVIGIEPWLYAWREVGATDLQGLRAIHAELVAAYSEAHRHYHTLSHLSECLALVDELMRDEPSTTRSEVRLALWFHDAIYDTHRHDNEARSAAWLDATASVHGVSADARARMVDLVMATRHLAPANNLAAELLLDIDLAILGAEPSRFAAYESEVRREYGWVPEAAFRKARAGIVSQFLARPTIYSTPVGRARFEAQARRNLLASLARLT